MDQNMTLEKRIAAELYSYQGRMSVFVDDLRGSTVEIGADEEFETASTIKAFILAVLYLQASRGRADLEEEITYEASQFVDGSGMLRALGVGAKLKVKDTATMMIICSDNIATLTATISWAPPRPGTTPPCLRRWQRARWSAKKPAPPCWASSASSTTTPC